MVVAFLISEKQALIQTDRQTDMTYSMLIQNTYVYFIGSEMIPSACYAYSSSDKHNRPCVWPKNRTDLRTVRLRDFYRLDEEKKGRSEQEKAKLIKKSFV